MGNQLDYWLVLDLGKVEGAVEVKINGKPAGLKLAPPYQFALSDFIRTGNNQFQFILTNTASNLLSLPKSFGIFGPVRIFPYPRIEKFWDFWSSKDFPISPDCFSKKGNRKTYQL